MAEVKFDRSQMDAINIEKNTVVSAGAGSGKTSVLSARFAHLVLDKKYRIDEILTLTFTKKATVEMYDRIYRTLKKQDPDSVQDFYKANIKTLDSYCTYIARQGAHFYGISPSFTIDKKAAEESIASMALPFILQHKDNPALKAFLSPKNHQSVAKDLFISPMVNNSTVACPIDFKADLKRQRDKIRRDWKSTCLEMEEMRSNLEREIENYEGNKNTVFFRKVDAELKKEIPEIPKLDDETFAKCDVSKMLEYIGPFSALGKCELKGKIPDDLKDLIKKIRSLCTIMESMANFVYGGKTTEALIQLIEEFQDRTLEMKRQLSILTYADISSLALKTLTEHPEIRAQEKKKYRSIMIDEFQDNNEMQKKLLFLLAEKKERMEKSIPSVEELCEGKLFFVGDEKQSIYRFRGADVSVFKGLSNDFIDGNLKLQTNYRSNPALIAAFNTIFGGKKYPPISNPANENVPSIFFTERNMRIYGEKIPDYEPEYTDAEISESDANALSEMEPGDYRKFYAPRIHVAFYDKNQAAQENFLTDDEAQALWNVRKIKELIDERNADPGDIAILFRNYKYQTTYEKYLLYLGIPYNSESVTGLFNSAVVTDIISFLRICAYPKDLCAFEKVLRSAIVNLSTAESNAILSQSENAFSLDAENILSGKSAERYLHAKKLYESLSEKSKDQPIAKTVSELWYDSGYRYETLWNNRSTMYATLYDRIFELARLSDAESKNLSDFVDGLKTYEDESKHLDDMDIPMEQKSGVHLMSIHKSKGLQFKYVFIPGIDHGSSRDSNRYNAYVSKEFGFTANTPPIPSFSKSNYFWDIVSKEISGMANAELKRLVYVALTRAIDEIYISGCTGGKPTDSILTLMKDSFEFFSDDENRPYSPMTFESIEAMEKPAPIDFVKGKNEIIERLEKSYADAETVEKEHEKSRYVSPSRLENEPEDFNGHTESEIPFSEIDEIVRNKSGFSLADFGTVAHAHMEAAINGCPPKIPNACMAALEGNKKYAETVLNACKKMTSMFVKTETGKAALESSWHRAEYAFRSSVADTIISGQMDLVFKGSDGGFTVVDYKTNQEINPEIYLNQLACYRQAVSQIMNVPASSVKCVLFYLRHGKEIDVTEKCNGINLEEAIKNASA